MFNVADYFKKFARLEEGAVSQRGAVHEALRDICGVDKADFEVRKGILTIRGHSTVKSMVFMKKKEVLERLSRTSPLSKIVDIR